MRLVLEYQSQISMNKNPCSRLTFKFRRHAFPAPKTLIKVTLIVVWFLLPNVSRLSTIR